jgi:hypothetical protein
MRSLKSILGSNLAEQTTDLGSGYSVRYLDVITGYLRHLRHAAQHVAGAVLMSGFYNTLSPMSPGAKSYFGDDAVLLEQRSPILKVANLKIPVLLTLAQFDPPGIALQTLALASQITQIQQAAPPLNCLAGHNHVSTVLSIGSPQKEIGELLIKYVRYFSQLGSVQ